MLTDDERLALRDIADRLDHLTHSKLIAEQSAKLRAIAAPRVATVARPLSEWHEDYGDALWWRFPVDEPPYVGSPLCDDWPGYHTHWTPIACPDAPSTRGPIGEG